MAMGALVNLTNAHDSTRFVKYGGIKSFGIYTVLELQLCVEVSRHCLFVLNVNFVFTVQTDFC